MTRKSKFLLLARLSFLGTIGATVLATEAFWHQAYIAYVINCVAFLALSGLCIINYKLARTQPSDQQNSTAASDRPPGPV